MTPVRLEHAAPRSRVKHSTTEPLRSLLGFLTLHVVTEMQFLVQKNLKNIMHGRVKMYAMR